MNRQLRFGLLVCLLLGSTEAVPAQDRVAWQIFRNNQQTQTYVRTVSFTNNALRAHRHRTSSSNSRSNSTHKQAGQQSRRNQIRSPLPATVNAVTGRTTFRPVVASIVPQQMAAEVGKSESERKEMQAFFAQCLQNYESFRRKQGLPIKDVALAVSYFIATNYNIHRGGAALTEQQSTALRNEIVAALKEDQQFQALSNREKQEMYETMAVMAEFALVGYESGKQKGDEQAVRQFQQLARENLERLLGTSADKLHFTDNGLEF